MSEQKHGMISMREAQQLQRSVQSRSIREIALTVCTIRGLATEVKSILADLYSDDELMSQAATRSLQFPMQMNDASPNKNNPPLTPGADPVGWPAILKGSSHRQLLKKPLSRRYRCPLCFLSFSTRSSVCRHKKRCLYKSSSMTNFKKPDATASMSPIAATTSASEVGPNLPDTSTSFSSMKPVNPAISPGHIPSLSSEDHLSPMPSIAEILQVGPVKSEPPESTSTKQGDMSTDHDDIQTILPPNPYILEPIDTDLTDPRHDSNGENSTESPNDVLAMGDNQENEEIIRSAVDEQLSIVPPDGFYKCTDCSWKTRNCGSMKSHLLAHKGVLPFSCHWCNYKTNKKHVLVRHYSIHTGTKPHNCPICRFGSLDHIGLYKHMIKSHPGVHPYTCTICGHHTTTQTLLKKHMRTEHMIMTSSAAQLKPTDLPASSSSAANNSGHIPLPPISQSSMMVDNSFNQPVFP